jgi:hypothetical protein
VSTFPPTLYHLQHCHASSRRFAPRIWLPVYFHRISYNLARALIRHSLSKGSHPGYASEVRVVRKYRNQIGLHKVPHTRPLFVIQLHYPIRWGTLYIYLQTHIYTDIKSLMAFVRLTLSRKRCAVEKELKKKYVPLGRNNPR